MILQGKSSFITGGSKGIGRGIVETFLAEGSNVYCFSRSKIQNYSVLESLAKTKGLKLVHYTGEISKEDQISDAINLAHKDAGTLDVLVNNVGITRDKLFIGMKKDDWDEVIDINLTSIFHSCKVAVPIMLKQRLGSIINISSIVGITGNPGQVNYCASKAGMIGFTKSLSLELAKKNIRVNAIAPGFIETDMTNSIPEEYKKKLIEQIPMKRIGTPTDIANACVFFASDKATYITGQVLVVSGGLGG